MLIFVRGFAHSSGNDYICGVMDEGDKKWWDGELLNIRWAYMYAKSHNITTKSELDVQMNDDKLLQTLSMYIFYDYDSEPGRILSLDEVHERIIMRKNVRIKRDSEVHWTTRARIPSADAPERIWMNYYKLYPKIYESAEENNFIWKGIRMKEVSNFPH